MSDWQRKLDLTDLWNKYDEKEISLQSVSASVAYRLGNLDLFEDSYSNLVKEEIIEAFQDMAIDPSSDENDFNRIMKELYDWGDFSLDNKFGGKKVCRIKTF